MKVDAVQNQKFLDMFITFEVGVKSSASSGHGRNTHSFFLVNLSENKT